MKYVMFTNLVNNTVEDYWVNMQLFVEEMRPEHNKMFQKIKLWGI